MTTQLMTRTRRVILVRKKTVCVKGESNPQLNLGRVPCYHYTIDALRLLADVKIDIYIP